jgi:hypothetical protein
MTLIRWLRQFRRSNVMLEERPWGLILTVGVQTWGTGCYFSGCVSWRKEDPEHGIYLIQRLVAEADHVITNQA